MAVSSTGNDAKGGKQPVTKAGKTGTKVKGMGDKASGADGKGSEKMIDQEAKVLSKGSGHGGKDEVLSGAKHGTVTGSMEHEKKDPASVLQELVHAREKEIKDIELKITNTHDIRERSILAVQLKGAQHALKEALVSMSLTQKKAEASLDVAWSSDGDGSKKETSIKNSTDEQKRGHNKLIQSTEIEFFVDNHEDTSDEDMDSGSTDNNQKNKKQKQHDNTDTINLTDSSDTELRKTKANSDDNKSSPKETSWADMSDDDTVIQTNMEHVDENEWKIASSKRSKKEKTANKSISNNNQGHTDMEYSSTSNKKDVKIANPYKSNKNQGPNDTKIQRTTVYSSLASYAEAATGKQRSPNNNSISVTTSFTPRLSGAGEYKRVAKELLAYAKEVAPEVMLLPWNDHSGLGPIKEEDLANPKNYMDTIKHYFDKPPYVTMQPGTPVYGIGVRFSVN